MPEQAGQRRGGQLDAHVVRGRGQADDPGFGQDLHPSSAASPWSCHRSSARPAGPASFSVIRVHLGPQAEEFLSIVRDLEMIFYITTLTIHRT